MEAARLLEQKGISAQVLKLTSIAPLDLESIASCAGRTGRLLVAEECVDANCVGREIVSGLMLGGNTGIRAALVNLGNKFVPQGTVPQLRALCGIDGASLAKKAMEVVRRG